MPAIAEVPRALFRKDIYPDDPRVLKHLQSLGVEKVLYPGAGDDALLDPIFCGGLVKFDHKQLPGCIPLTFSDAPKVFRPGQFDALYLSSIHIDPSDFEGLLGLIRNGGFVIWNNKKNLNLGGINREWIEERPDIVSSPHPFKATLIYAYTKIPR